MVEKFAQYEILRKLAAGGMAEVLLAKQVGIGGFERLVCLKRILPHLSEEEDFIKMFQDEARIAANLIHPNIAQIYDIGQANDTYFIAMEYVRGVDLRHVYNQEVARGQTMAQPFAAHIAMGCAAGLDYAHRQTSIDGRPLGIVHRDISPQNILITYDGHVKIVDFGVAKAAGKMAQTRAGVLKGKYSYMSPEQASGDPIDGRTDVFALGITLYEVTTGTRLFKRDAELETLHAVLACKVTPPCQVRRQYDEELEKIVMKALAADPEDRYQSAGDMEKALERYLISKGHAPVPSSLAGPMQELFADKIADELLFGGPAWDEEHTPSRQKKGRGRSADRRQERQGEGPSEPSDAPATHGSAPSRSSDASAESDLDSDLSGDGQHFTTGELGATTIIDDGLPGSLDPDGLPHDHDGSGASSTSDDWGLLDTGDAITMPQWLGASGQPRAAHTRPGMSEAGSSRSVPESELYARTTPGTGGLSAHDSQTSGVSTVALVTIVACAVVLSGYLLVRSRRQTPYTGTQIVEVTAPGAFGGAESAGGDRSQIQKPTETTVRDGRIARRGVRPSGAAASGQEDTEGDSAAGPQEASTDDAGRDSTSGGADPADSDSARLSVLAPIPLTVTERGKRLGDTPLHEIPVRPGVHRLRLHNKQEGVTYKRRVKISPGGHESITVQMGKGHLVLNATPWAWVQFGKYPPQQTPVRVEVYEGEYLVVFECPDGKRRTRTVKVPRDDMGKGVVACAEE